MDVVKGNCPPGPGSSLERNGDGERGVVFSLGKGEEPGHGTAVRVGAALVRHKVLSNLISPAPEQDLQRLADELGRFPVEQSGAIGLRCDDQAGPVNHHGLPARFKLGRGVAGRLAGTNGVGLWFSEGRNGAAGSLVLASGFHIESRNSVTGGQ
jgi:hypothetical protein